MPSGFIPNKNFQKELEAEPEYPKGLAEETQNAAEFARAFAPVEEGDYRDGIKVIVQNKDVYLSGTDFKSHWIEYGTVDTPIFAPLRRGVRAAGLRFSESSK